MAGSSGPAILVLMPTDVSRTMLFKIRLASPKTFVAPYMKSGSQLQGHPDGMKAAVSLLSLWKLNAPGIMESKDTSTLV